MMKTSDEKSTHENNSLLNAQTGTKSYRLNSLKKQMFKPTRSVLRSKSIRPLKPVLNVKKDEE